VSEPLARLYDLALRALDDHERRADALRGRLGPTLAAAALGVTLLSGPLVGGAYPTTAPGKLALLVTVSGLAATIGAAFCVLLTRLSPIPGLDPVELLNELTEKDLLDDARSFYSTMIERIGDRMERDAELVDQLTTAFTALVCGILVMLCGLAFAALVG